MRVWIATGALVVIVLALSFGGKVLANCPKATYGSGEKEIKYFSSPLCVACWSQKPIIEKFAAENGEKFTLKEYNSDFCREEAAPHIIQGVPAFMVDGIMIYGLQDEQKLREMIS